MAILNTEVKTVGEFLKNRQLTIPIYQRPYKWNVKNVVQLIEDIQRFKTKPPYRIGTIVIHKEINKETNKVHYNIVDGQQRTISFILIVKALLNRTISMSESLSEQLQLLATQLPTFTFSNDTTRLNIQTNYYEIERRLITVEADFIDFFLNQCEITYFVIDDVSEAFQFFDSQNARGRDLEPHDLLKAFHLREMSNSNTQFSKDAVEKTVDTWEEMDAKELANLFADFLYRVRGWSKGYSSRYFSKSDTPMFKGINLDKIDNYPYVQLYKYTDSYIATNKEKQFPFQLDQIIINGKNFFDLITYYNLKKIALNNQIKNTSGLANKIIHTVENYDGKTRTGDKYVRLLFDCALFFYIDKFGDKFIEQAIEKIFIWAYSIRLTYQSLQMASVDNYVVNDSNLFRKISQSLYKEEILNIELPKIKVNIETRKIDKLVSLFTTLKYINHEQ